MKCRMKIKPDTLIKGVGHLIISLSKTKYKEAIFFLFTMMIVIITLMVKKQNKRYPVLAAMVIVNWRSKKLAIDSSRVPDCDL